MWVAFIIKKGTVAVLVSPLSRNRFAVKVIVLLQSLHEEFGWTTKLLAALSGRYIHTMLKREETRMAIENRNLSTR